MGSKGRCSRRGRKLDSYVFDPATIREPASTHDKTRPVDRHPDFLVKRQLSWCEDGEIRAGPCPDASPRRSNETGG